MINGINHTLMHRSIRQGAQTGYRAVVAVVSVLAVCLVVLAYPVLWVLCNAYCMATGRRMDDSVVSS